MQPTLFKHVEEARITCRVTHDLCGVQSLGTVAPVMLSPVRLSVVSEVTRYDIDDAPCELLGYEVWWEVPVRWVTPLTHVPDMPVAAPPS